MVESMFVLKLPQLFLPSFVKNLNRVSMRLAKSLRLLDLAHLFHVSDITCGVVWCFAPIWGCFYSHKSKGSEGLVVSPLWRVNVCGWAFACRRGGRFGRKKAVF